MHDEDPIKPWATVAEGAVEDHFVLGLQRIERRSPRTNKVREFVILRASPWVNVIAITTDGKVVFVRQYRQAAELTTLEVPGGMVDPGEDPGEAAARELLEETGYGGGSPRSLGWVHSNPAILDNRCYTYLIEGVDPVSEPDPDEGEDLQVVLLSLEEVKQHLREGKITHSLVVAAFLHYFLERGL